jgi:hypothetical protein
MRIPGTDGTGGHRETIPSRDNAHRGPRESTSGRSRGRPSRHAPLYRGMGATAPIYQGERHLDHQTARRAGRTIGGSDNTALAGTTAHRPASGTRHRRAAAEQGANRDTPQGGSSPAQSGTPHRSETGITHPGHVLPGLAANTRPTRRLASDHGRDVRQDERSRQ